jgi:hypothetical protein
MQSFDKKRFYSLYADANALGGFFEEPIPKIIPTLAPVSLPAVGGFATARSEAFNLDEMVSCTSAYTRVSGREHAADGSISILITAVVEGLNILEVVTAERIVTQVSISLPNDNGLPRFSVAGSCFHGLRIGCRDVDVKLNSVLHGLNGENRDGSSLTWQNIQQAGRSQAERLTNAFKDRGDKEAYRWAVNRHGWMASEPPPRDGGKVLCSLVDGLEGAGASGSCGHIVQIPGFGRIILGELWVSGSSIQLLAIRADLGCPVRGKVGIAAGGGGGQGEN